MGEPSSLLADEPAARVIAAAITDTLVQRNARDEFVPRLAVEVPTLDNGGLRHVVDRESGPVGRLVATFTLRAGLRWHDGVPITSDDVRFAHQEDRSAPAGSGARAIAERVERVEVVDERRVRLYYRAGERWENYPLAARVLPRHRLEGATPQARAAYAREPVHAGPFAVAIWVSGIGATLSAFPGHALGPPELGRIEVRFFADRERLLDALRRGEVDVAPSPGLEADLVRALDRLGAQVHLQAYYTQAQSVEMLRFGRRFADHDVRRAVELTVDRQRIITELFAGRARVPRTYLVPPLWAAAELGSPARQDVTAARGLLAEAGYRPGTFGILERGGERLVVAILVAAGSRARAEAARLVAADLAAVGIAADVHERAADEVAAAVLAGSFDLALLAEPAADALAASERYAGAVGPWFDVLLASVRAAGDPAEKLLLYRELQRTWLEALPGLPLYQALLVDVAPPALLGIDPASHGAPLTWSARDWRFPP